VSVNSIHSCIASARGHCVTSRSDVILLRRWAWPGRTSRDLETLQYLGAVLWSIARGRCTAQCRRRTTQYRVPVPSSHVCAIDCVVTRELMLLMPRDWISLSVFGGKALSFLSVLILKSCPVFHYYCVFLREQLFYRANCGLVIDWRRFYGIYMLIIFSELFYLSIIIPMYVFSRSRNTVSENIFTLCLYLPVIRQHLNEWIWMNLLSTTTNLAE